jgi:hypothetical protein
MDWVNRIGMVLEFVSFWLAAPEILGKQRLLMVENRIRKMLHFLPRLSTPVIAILLVVMPLVCIGEFYLMRTGQIQRSAYGPTITAPKDGMYYGVFYIIFPLFLLLTGVYFLVDKIGPALLHSLADDKRYRHRALIVGATFFTLGFILQIITTFAK